MSSIKPSGLLFFPVAADVTHIGRSMIEGCTTECGVKLVRGMPFTRQEPNTQLCQKCVTEIKAWPHIRGLMA